MSSSQSALVTQYARSVRCPPQFVISLLITHVAASLSLCVSVLVGSALAAQLSDLGDAGDTLDPLQELGEEKLIEKL